MEALSVVALVTKNNIAYEIHRYRIEAAADALANSCDEADFVMVPKD